MSQVAQRVVRMAGLLILAALVLIGLLLALVGWCGLASMPWLAVRYVPPAARPVERSRRRDEHG